jgi:hypothetical protein
MYACERKNMTFQFLQNQSKNILKLIEIFLEKMKP